MRLPISPPSHLFGARNFTAFCPVWDGLRHRSEPDRPCPCDMSATAIRPRFGKTACCEKTQQPDAADGARRMNDTKKATARMKQAIMAASSRG